MSKHEFEGAPVPADATQLRHVLQRADEPEVIVRVPPLPQPRAAAVDPLTEATLARVPYEAPQTVGEAAPWGSVPAPAWPAPSPPPVQHHSGPMPAVPPPQRPDDTRAGLLAAMIVAIVLIAGGAGFWMTWHARSALSSELSSGTTDYSGSLPAGGSDPASGTGSSGGVSGDTSTPATTTTTTQAAPPVDPEAAALDQLNAMRSDSVARVLLDGRWVAQVASKSVGITDPLQTTETGGHTFMAADILAESLQARQSAANPDLNVYVRWGTDFGKRSQAPDGSPYWITLVDAGFGSSNAVTTWCRSTYSSLTPAQLADTCAARQLTPPHS